MCQYPCEQLMNKMEYYGRKMLFCILRIYLLIHYRTHLNTGNYMPRYLVRLQSKNIWTFEIIGIIKLLTWKELY